MTTIRLSPKQMKRLREAQDLLERKLGRRISQGQTVALLAEFDLRNLPLQTMSLSSESVDHARDPFYDTSTVFDAGPSDARTLDRLIYGDR